MAADPDVPHNAYSKLDCQTNAQDYGRAKAGHARFSGLSKEAGHGEDCISRLTEPTVTKGKGRRDFSQRPLFMPATTYSPTHFRVQYNRPGGA